MIQILFAFLGGVLTVAAPCILPVLPILLGSSVGNSSKSRPLFIVLGFVATFALASLIISIVATHIPFLSAGNVRIAAIVLIGLFGVFLLWPVPFEWLTSKFSGLTNQAASSANKNGSALALGMTLGLVWAPCAGPILAAILALIALQGNTAKSIALLLAYAIGAGLPMLAIAYGSQYVSTKVRSIAKYSRLLQQVFGVLIILLAAAMYFQYDTLLENKLSAYFPQSGLESKIVGTTGQKQAMRKNYGPAPEFSGISKWLNLPDGKQTLNLSELKGKVVLVDFWTYSCINCIRTLPYVTKWYDTYKDNGLVVVGVHTPEFDFEKVTGNVQTAAKRFGIHYPIAQDNDYGTWNAYSNQYWPAEYLIGRDGNIAYTHFGEGNYDTTENAIRQLLGLNTDLNAATSEAAGNVQSPEMYFGTDRLQYLTPSQKPDIGGGIVYELPDKLALNNFAMEGNWEFFPDKAQCLVNCKIRLRFSSGKLFMVAASNKPVTLHITVDGKIQPDVTVTMSQLYTLFNSNEYREHDIVIEISDHDLNAFTFTFG